MSEDQIIMIALDSLKNIKYRNPIEPDDYLRDKIQDIGLRNARLNFRQNEQSS